MADIAALKMEYCVDPQLSLAEMGYCEGYIDQCVDQGKGKSPSESTYEVVGESGAKIGGLDYDGCLGIASFASISQGKPKGYTGTGPQYAVKREPAPVPAKEPEPRKAHEDSGTGGAFKVVRVGKSGGGLPSVYSKSNLEEIDYWDNGYIRSADLIMDAEAILNADSKAICAGGLPVVFNEFGLFQGCYLSGDQVIQGKNFSGGDMLVVDDNGKVQKKID